MSRLWPALANKQHALMAQNHWPQSMMWTAPEGSGKALFASALMQAFHCMQDDRGQAACGRCTSCRLWQKHNHPDHLRLRVPEDKTRIAVDQVRQLVQFAQRTAQFPQGKTVCIEQAERMSLEAANALLKTLEEPANGLHILLLLPQTRQLPATLRSRCQHWHLPPLPEQDALAWLHEQLPDADTEQLQRCWQIADQRLLLALEYASGDVPPLPDFATDLDALQGGRISAEQLSKNWAACPMDILLPAWHRFASAYLRHCLGIQVPKLGHLSMLPAGALLNWLNDWYRAKRLLRHNAKADLLCYHLLRRWPRPGAALRS